MSQEDEDRVLFRIKELMHRITDKQSDDLDGLKQSLDAISERFAKRLFDSVPPTTRTSSSSLQQQVDSGSSYSVPPMPGTSSLQQQVENPAFHKISILVNDLMHRITEIQSGDLDLLEQRPEAIVERAVNSLFDSVAPTPSTSSLQEQVGRPASHKVSPTSSASSSSSLRESLSSQEVSFLINDLMHRIKDNLNDVPYKPTSHDKQVALGEIEPWHTVAVTNLFAEKIDMSANLTGGANSDSDEWAGISDESDTDLLVTRKECSTCLGIKPSEESSQTTHCERATACHGEAVCLKEAACETRAEEMKTLYQKAFEAELRMDKEIHNVDWLSAQEMEAMPGMPHLGPSEDIPDATVLSEWRILREFLWMLLAPTNCRCFGLDPSGKFKPRPNITLVQVNTHVLWTFLERYCKYFDMVSEAKTFGEYLNGAGKEPPSTYRAYFAALMEIVEDFKQTVSQVMKRVAAQESTETLISVTAELRPSLRRLEFSLSVHRRATCDWKIVPNWVASIRLLSVLYWNIMQPLPCGEAVIAVDLFVKSFQPYVTIIDHLLTVGKYIDIHQEFIIYRADNLESSMRESWDDGFYVRPYHGLLHELNMRAPSLLENVVSAVVLGSKSIYVVSRLDKLCKMTNYQTKCFLYDELITRLEVQFARYVTLEEPTPRVAEKQPEVLQVTRKRTADILEDPYLREAFREDTDTKANQVIERLKHPAERLKRYTAKGTIRYQRAFEHVFQGLVWDKYNILGKMINTVMRKDVQIDKHLKVLRAVFMIEAGDLISVCYDCLFEKDKDERYWLYSHLLSSNIDDYFDSSFPGFNYFQVSVDRRFLNPNILEAVDGIELAYKVDWPLSFIVNKTNLVLYNEIFRNLLKLKLTLASLERLRFSDLYSHGVRREPTRAAVSSRLSRWHLLRFRLISIVKGLHCFAMNHITYTYGAALDILIETANDFDLIVQEHSLFLQAIHELCINPLCSPKLAKNFYVLLDLSLCCAALWPFGQSSTTLKSLSHIEETYIKIHQDIRKELADFVPEDSRLQIDGLQALFY